MTEVNISNIPRAQKAQLQENKQQTQRIELDPVPRRQNTNVQGTRKEILSHLENVN